MSINAMKKMVAALEESLDLVEQDYDTDWRHGLPTRKAQLDGKLSLLNAHKEAIATLRAAIEAAERQEPVAKVKKCHMDDRDWFDIDPLVPHDNFTSGQLLYTTPQAERQQNTSEHSEPVAEVVGGLRWIESVPWSKRPTSGYLYTTPQPAIPAGWQLVPVEPTPEMSSFANTGVHWQIAERIYKAMLAAAPEVPK